MADAGTPRILGPKALEMIMQDVFAGMEDLALMHSYRPSAEIAEVVAVEPATNRPSSRNNKQVLDFAQFQRRKTP